jgi:hypothetical protein
VSLVVLYWRPSTPGRYWWLFDLLEEEIADFASRVDDQRVAVKGLGTSRLLDDWSAAGSPDWLSAHAAALRRRYDPPLDRAVDVPAQADRLVSFGDWAQAWLTLARYHGREVPDLDRRVHDVRSLWDAKIPPDWERGTDARLIDPKHRYLRRHRSGGPKPGSEHELEYQILEPDPLDVPTFCFGGRLIDGINAVPLARDHAGGRSGNVEADMLLLTEIDGKHRLLLVEVKTISNGAWYATIENLRQLRLFNHSATAQQIFRRRRPKLTDALPVTAVVLAPRSYFEAPGAKHAAVEPAQHLITNMRTAPGVDVQLAIWDTDARSIEAFRSTPADQ